MGCKLIINSSNPSIKCQLFTNRSKPSFGIKTLAFSSNYKPDQDPISTINISTSYDDVATTIKFKTLGACKLGISRFPDFEYDAQGGTGIGTGTGTGSEDDDDNKEIIWVSFDLKTLYIPPLTSETTKFLGLPLPPLLKIDIVPQLFQGNINQKSGQVDLEFMAKFWFSVGSIYRAPPLMVKTVLTSEESKGTMRSGRGERLDKQGKCRLVGVATVDPIDDFFMNTFLALPTECLAILNAVIHLS